MVPQWFHASLIPVVNVPTTPVLDVRSTTVVSAMLSTMMTEAITSLTTAEHIQVAISYKMLLHTHIILCDFLLGLNGCTLVLSTLKLSEPI